MKKKKSIDTNARVYFSPEKDVVTKANHFNLKHHSCPADSVILYIFTHLNETWFNSWHCQFHSSTPWSHVLSQKNVPAAHAPFQNECQTTPHMLHGWLPLRIVNIPWEGVNLAHFGRGYKNRKPNHLPLFITPFKFSFQCERWCVPIVRKCNLTCNSYPCWKEASGFRRELLSHLYVFRTKCSEHLSG